MLALALLVVFKTDADPASLQSSRGGRHVANKSPGIQIIVGDVNNRSLGVFL